MTTHLSEAEAAIRKAMEAGPTPGPWTVALSNVVGLPHIRSFSGTYVMDAAPRGTRARTKTRQRVDADFIAACNPAAITELLDSLAALRQELAEARKPQWQPIETAPKDANVLVFDSDRNVVGEAFFDHAESDCWVWADEMLVSDPTLWMPLPQPPEPA